MLAHVISSEESIQHLDYLTQTGQFEQCLQQSILILPQIHEKKQQGAVLCELIKSAFELARFQEAAYYFPLFEKITAIVKVPSFSIYRQLFKGHFHMRIHGDAIGALTSYQQGLALAFEAKEYTILAEFIKHILRYSGGEADVDRLLPLAELAYIFSQRTKIQKEDFLISAMMALLECYSLADKVEQFEKLEKQLSVLPSLSNFPNELTRLQVLRARILRVQGYCAQALCLMQRTNLYYEKLGEYHLLLQQLYTQKMLSREFMPDRVAILAQKIERTRKLAKLTSCRFTHHMKKEEMYCEETAILHFHQAIEERLANKEEFLYLLAFAQHPACFQRLLQTPVHSLALSGNRVLYVMEGSDIPTDFPAYNQPGIFLTAVQPQEDSSAMQLFHEAHAKIYYIIHNKNKNLVRSPGLS